MANELTIRSIVQYGGWLASAKAGDRCVYHSGHLTSARQDSADINALADHVIVSSESGLVRLFQRRRREDTWDYLAVRCRAKPLKFYGKGSYQGDRFSINQE